MARKSKTQIKLESEFIEEVCRRAESNESSKKMAQFLKPVFEEEEKGRKLANLLINGNDQLLVEMLKKNPINNIDMLIGFLAKFGSFDESRRLTKLSNVANTKASEKANERYAATKIHYLQNLTKYTNKKDAYRQISSSLKVTESHVKRAIKGL